MIGSRVPTNLTPVGFEKDGMVLMRNDKKFAYANPSFLVPFRTDEYEGERVCEVAMCRRKGMAKYYHFNSEEIKRGFNICTLCAWHFQQRAPTSGPMFEDVSIKRDDGKILVSGFRDAIHPQYYYFDPAMAKEAGSGWSKCGMVLCEQDTARYSLSFNGITFCRNCIMLLGLKHNNWSFDN